MRTIDRFLKRNCWVDLFEGTYFLGRMRRIFGPADINDCSGQSMIVGPGAQVELRSIRDGKPVTIKLNPRRLIPNLDVATEGVKINSAIVTSVGGKKPRGHGKSPVRHQKSEINGKSE